MKFSAEREWDQFHNPKNLAIALSVECSELLEEFQWLTEKQAADIMKHQEQADRVKEEIADITAYLLLLTSKLNIDLEQALLDKITQNAEKYPVEKFKGSAKKYNR
ncbi:nucleotide pyrophosphohydrolase [Chromobacterium violaceum]|uniref:nucleotide pyrophosphohydrolase n=1 Tax=Chromobacterium violaceum TaxID=536 RepID=UPI001EF19B51|nr:nucleotide pyrophosphohydrolase [Chromobacterium violaceum]